MRQVAVGLFEGEADGVEIGQVDGGDEETDEAGEQQDERGLDQLGKSPGGIHGEFLVNPGNGFEDFGRFAGDGGDAHFIGEVAALCPDAVAFQQVSRVRGRSGRDPPASNALPRVTRSIGNVSKKLVFNRQRLSHHVGCRLHEIGRRIRQVRQRL